MTTSGTTVVRRQLGRRLRRLRESAGKTAADVAEAGVASKAKLSRIENGWSTVKMADVRALCWLYDVDPQSTDTLCRMATGTVTPGWWEEPPGSPGADDRLYPGLEAAASRMYCYETELVPALVQTPEYLRAVVDSWPAGLELRAERQVAELAHRVRVGFERTEPLVVRAVLEPAVLNRSVGGPEVMAAQVRKLLQHSRSPDVEIKVLPWASGAHAAMRGAFTMLEFDSEDDPPVACIETLAGTRYVGEPETLSLYRRLFTAIRGQSVPLEQYLSTGTPSIDLRSINGGTNGATNGTGVSRPDPLPRR